MTIPLQRRAARVLLVDAAGRVLLFLGYDPDNRASGTWWFTPGGGLEPGENSRDGAVREVREETALVLRPENLGEVVLERDAAFRLAGVDYAQSEQFFLAHIGAHDVDTAGFSDFERRFVLDHRWWTVEQLGTTTETVYPEGLAALLSRLLA